MLVKHALDSPEALENSLGVIHAIHAHSKIADVDSQLLEDFSARGGSIAVNISSVLGIGVSHADRKWTNESLVALAAHGEAVPVSIRFERTVHSLEKIIAMRL